MRGPNPHNFFTLLRDGLELTLRRFPGLNIDRRVPCPGHDGGEQRAPMVRLLANSCSRERRILRSSATVLNFVP